jgi:hypothetical protein
MPANQVSGAVGYLVGSATALALSIGPQHAPAGGCQVRGIYCFRLPKNEKCSLHASADPTLPNEQIARRLKTRRFGNVRSTLAVSIFSFFAPI